MFPGAAPGNVSYTPAPLTVPGMPAALPTVAAVPAAPAQPIWQPGMPLQPAMPQAAAPSYAPQIFPGVPQPQFYQPQPAAFLAETNRSFTPFPVGAPVGQPAQTIVDQFQVMPNGQMVETITAAPVPQYQSQYQQYFPAEAQYQQQYQQYVPAEAQYQQFVPAEQVTPSPIVETFAQPAPVSYASPIAQVAAAPVAYAAPATATMLPSVPSVPISYAAPGPAVSYLPAPVQQTASYIPAPPIVETVAAQPQVSSYIPAPAPMVAETFAMPQVTYAAQPALAPTIIQQAPASYIPAPIVETVQQPAVVGEAMPGGQSVIVEQVGDWLVCEDALGIFYHHTPTQQSFDNAPSEFLMLFPGGYTPPPLGAFAAAGYGGGAVVSAPTVATVAGVPTVATVPQVAGGVVETFVQPQVTYAPQVLGAPASYGGAASYVPAMGTQILGAPQVMAAPQVMGVPSMVGQPMGISTLPPMMAKVLN